MKNKLHYEVRAIREIRNPNFPDKSQDEYIGGDMELIWQGSEKTKCYHYAMETSKKDNITNFRIHEIMLEEFDGKERTQQWYFKDGRMTFTMQES